MSQSGVSTSFAAVLLSGALVLDPAPEFGLHREQSGAIGRRAVQSLPRAQEQVLHKAFAEAKSHREIAAELGLPLGTVKSRIRLALAHLRATLPLADLR